MKRGKGGRWEGGGLETCMMALRASLLFYEDHQLIWGKRTAGD